MNTPPNYTSECHIVHSPSLCPVIKCTFIFHKLPIFKVKIFHSFPESEPSVILPTAWQFGRAVFGVPARVVINTRPLLTDKLLICIIWVTFYCGRQALGADYRVHDICAFGLGGECVLPLVRRVAGYCCQPCDHSHENKNDI